MCIGCRVHLSAFNLRLLLQVEHTNLERVSAVALLLFDLAGIASLPIREIAYY